MNCEKLRTVLDQYIDGETDDVLHRAMEEHVQSCEMCARELRAAQMVRDSLLSMDKEIAVPLEAQAAWRDSIRKEARKRNIQRKLRVVYGVAAALIIALGSSLIMSEHHTGGIELQSTAGLIARDGEIAAADYAAEALNDYDVWKKIEVDNPKDAIGFIEDLTAEYSGTCKVQDAQVCRIELPADFLEEFLSAVAHMGRELDSEMLSLNKDTAVIYFQVCEKS